MSVRELLDILDLPAEKREIPLVCVMFAAHAHAHPEAAARLAASLARRAKFDAEDVARAEQAARAAAQAN